ncbi:MAG: GNAT family N-acetyltransferase [Alphaproteobacteria bacterium]
MPFQSFTLRPEQPDDAVAIEALHANLFGPDRFLRAAYVLRTGVPHITDLSFVAGQQDGELAASVRLTPITIGDRPALILGPLVTAARLRGQGAGMALVRLCLAHAWAAGHEIVLLVGDLPYYAPLGFTHLGRGVITMPAPVDPDRVLVTGLRERALKGLAGPAQRWKCPPTG